MVEAARLTFATAPGTDHNQVDAMWVLQWGLDELGPLARGHAPAR